MSSVSMLIATDRGLSVGWRIEVELDGPFQVDDQVYWKLLVTGSVVRSEGRRRSSCRSEDPVDSFHRSDKSVAAMFNGVLL
jgi:hypothetical protein